MDTDHQHESLFVSESLVQARLCVSCGAYVSGRMLQEHVDFHESLTAHGDGAGEQLPLFHD